MGFCLTFLLYSVRSEEEWFVSNNLDLSNKRKILQDFMKHGVDTELLTSVEIDTDKGGTASCFESRIIPGIILLSSIAKAELHADNVTGLIVIPSFLPSECQTILLDRMLNRDLAVPVHKTNLDLHYNIEHPAVGKSFLDYDRKSVVFVAKDAELHPSLNMERVMTSKLRWMTLGGQYDWTKKRYPDGIPPSFPDDIYHLLHGAFPTMKPQAAIGTLFFRS